jgi:hypothetical protein
VDRLKVNVGGRPKKDIPVRLIHKLSNAGPSIVGVVPELKRQGQSISVMNVSRVLSDERN